MSYKKLLEPITVNGMTLKNRMVVPPLATNFSTRQGYVTDQLCSYYAERAKGGFGLIEIEVAAVCPQGRSVTNELGIWSDDQIPGLTKLASAIHDNGAKTIIQLHHCGSATSLATINDGIAGKDLPIEGASPIADCLMNDPVRELTTEDVYRVIRQFVEAAVRAQKSGFDGVQIHCTHGYLLAQFLSRHANKRIDEFGGSIQNRTRIVTEIIKGVRNACGKDFVIDLRMPADEFTVEGIDPHEAAIFARYFEEAGIDMLNVTCCNYHSIHYMSVPGHIAPGYNLENIRKIKDVISVPLIAGGRINDPDLAEYVLESGVGDLVYFGREHVADPHIPNKIAAGRTDEIIPCISCNESCLGYIFAGGKLCCLVNPRAGKEGEYNYDPLPEDRRKKVSIIGAGPAGLVAAITAARKGHTVDVYDEREQIGGEFRIAAFPPGKQAIAKAIHYYGVMCKKYGVNLHMGVKADEEMLKNLDADVVMLATGSNPAMPPIPGLDDCKIKTTTSPVLEGKVQAGQNVLIAGGGFMAVELAEFLLEHGRSVTIVEMRGELAADAEITVKPLLRSGLTGVHDPYQILPAYCTPILNATIQRFTADGLVYEKEGETVTLSGFDTVVIALGLNANNSLEEVARKYHENVVVIGDANGTGLANKATEEGMAAAMALG